MFLKTDLPFPANVLHRSGICGCPKLNGRPKTSERCDTLKLEIDRASSLRWRLARRCLDTGHCSFSCGVPIAELVMSFQKRPKRPKMRARMNGNGETKDSKSQRT
jgi:hypothetical protein